LTTTLVLMKINKLVAATATAGLLSLGAAGVAVADTSSTSTSTPAATSPAATGAATCTKAPDRLQNLQARLAIVNDGINLLQLRDTYAKAHGRTAVVTKVEARLDKLNTRRTNITARMTKIEQRCSLPAPSAP
jgi:hypothetical protein